MIYESDLLNDWYVLFHYGGADEILDGSAFSTANLPEKSPLSRSKRSGLHPLNPGWTDGLNQWALITNFLSIMRHTGAILRQNESNRMRYLGIF